MERSPVSSSNIAAIGYEEESETLEVEFNDGSIYQYFGVPINIYKGLRGASSKGQYLAQHIKGYYRFAKV